MTRFSMAVHDDRIEIQPSRVVSMMSRNEMPSMPMMYPAPIVGIQLLAAPSMNLKPGSKRLSQNQGTSGREMRNPPSEKMLAIQRMAALLSLGTNKSRIAPSCGVKRMMERMCACILTLSSEVEL